MSAWPPRCEGGGHRISLRPSACVRWRGAGRPTTAPTARCGSVAQAALLDGELSQSHGDVDLVISRTELEWRLRQLAVLGFDAFTVYYEPVVRTDDDAVAISLPADLFG